MINENFTYNGRVTIEINRNGKLIKKRYFNQGTDALFKMFAYALAGRDISKMIPAYFTISKEALVSSNLPLIKIYYKQVDYGNNGGIKSNICRLQCNLPLARISTLLENNDKVFKLNIKSFENNILATIDLPANSFDELEVSDQVVIIWDLMVDNSDEKTQTEENING